MRKTFNQQKDDTIMACIAKYPQNIRAALEMASKKIGHPYGSTNQRYYTVLRPVRREIAVVSRSGVASLGNQKNAKRTLSNLKHFKSEHDFLVNLMEKLTKKEKVMLLKLLI